MKGSGAFNLLKLAPDLGHSVANQPPIRFDLRFAGPSEETEAASLALEMGPAPNEAPGLVFEMRELDLQLPLGGRGPFTEYFEDQAGPVDHLGPDFILKVLLLDRSERR